MTENIFKKHKEAYLREATIHIEEITRYLLKLEKEPDDEALHRIFRSLHTLKSNSATMSYQQTANLCHALEDLFDGLLKNKIVMSSCIDLLFKSVDYLSASFKKINASDEELDTTELVAEIRHVLTTPDEKINYDRPLKKILSVAMEKIHTIDVKVERLDDLMKLAEELLVNRLKLNVLSESINNPELTTVVGTLERLVTEMQYNIIQARLLPIRVIFFRFPRMVRDLAKYQKKEIILQTEGGDIELDRTLLDELGEVLAHLIRNAIDHGIETVEARLKLGKSPQATIALIAKRTKEYATIEVRDDGAGFDWQAFKNAAIKHHLLKSDATQEEVESAVFSGVSTSKEVTSLSGRGLGLAIVKQRMEAIGGSVSMHAKEGESATFILQIPLTLAVIKVLFVKVSQKIYAIPLDNIERLLIVTNDNFKGLLNYDAIVHKGENIPIVHLATLFDVTNIESERYPVVVVRMGEQKLGLCVDQLLSTEEVVIKPLSKSIKSNRFFSGSALIGSGEVVLIIDVAHLLLTRRKAYSRSHIHAAL